MTGSDGRVAQMLVLAATFLVVAIVIDSGGALFAHRAKGAPGLSGRNRLTGGLLLTAAAGLAFARRS